MLNHAKYLLLFLPLATAWGGSINLVGEATSSCVVTTLPTNAIVANDCSAIPGIEASGFGSFSIEVAWGDVLVVAFAAQESSDVSNDAADPNLVATESLSGHLDYDQNFVITGGSGVGFISSTLPIEDDLDTFGSTSCGFSISTGVNPTVPGGPVEFTFGVPFSLQISLDMNVNPVALHGYGPVSGEGCENDNGVQITNSQGQTLTGFDIEPTDLPLQETPEPGTRLLMPVGLLACLLMKLRAA